MVPRELHLVVPSEIDDPLAPSGGNTYDRRVRDGLRALGRTVRQHAVAGNWPRPSAEDRAALAAVLGALPEGAPVLLDGLVGCAVPEVLAPHAARLRLVALVHLPLADEVGAAPALADLEARALHCCSVVVATSSWAARRLAELHALPPDRIAVVPPGVAAHPPAPSGESLLCVGALTPTKGQDVLVEALALVRDRPWTCDLVGPPRDRRFAADLDRAIDRHGLGDRVRRLGPRPEATFWAGAGLLVLPSRVETYGMVVTEALARGIPLLAADAGGVAETLGLAPDGARPGLLVPPADPMALAGALRRWFDEPGLRARLRAAAAGRRPMLDGWEVTARCLAEVLTRLR